MSLRSLINLVYAALVRGKDEGELAEFDARIEAEPGKRPSRSHMAPPRSRGVDQLMAAVGLPQGPPPRKPEPERSAS